MNGAARANGCLTETSLTEEPMPCAEVTVYPVLMFSKLCSKGALMELSLSISDVSPFF